MQCRNYVKLFKAIADETRIDIIQILTNKKMCACLILKQLKIGQPTLSHHMKVLCNSQFVLSEKIGKKVYYWLNENTVEVFKVFFEKIGTNQKPCQENDKC